MTPKRGTLDLLIGASGDPAEALSDPKDLAALEGRGGRYETQAGAPVPVAVPDSVRTDLHLNVHLRLDDLADAGADGPVRISGDAFAAFRSELAPAKSFMLGGKDSWDYSFFGEISHVVAGSGGRRFVALCSVSHREPQYWSGTSVRGVLELEVPKHGEAVGLSFTLIAGTDGGIGVIHSWTAQLSRTSESLRRVRLVYDVHPEIGDGSVHAAIKQVMSPDGRFSASRVLERAGIALTATSDGQFLNAIPVDPILYEGQTLPHFHGIPQRLVNQIQTETEADWVNYCLFAADFGSQANGAPLKTELYGEAFGFEQPQDRFFSRYGMVINAAAVAENEVVAPDQIADPVDRIAYMLRFTVVHEFGHLLNLPHAWSRHRGHSLLGERRPEALSWMNYAGRHPFGPAAGAALRALPRKTDAQKAKKDAHIAARERVFFAQFDKEVARTGGFDDRERAFIRHAPLDHIAQGGRTFLDPYLPAPKLYPEPRSSQQGLQIVSLDAADNSMRALSEVELWPWRFDGSSNVLELPYLPAAIAFRGPDNALLPVKKMAEHAGNLQLIVHKLPPDPTQLPPLPVQTRVFTPDAIHDRGLSTTVAGFTAARVTKDLFGLLSSEQRAIEEINRLTPMPWVQYRALSQLFSNTAVGGSYAIQAVLHGERSIASQIVKMSFGPQRLHPRVTYKATEGPTDRFAFGPGNQSVEAVDVAGHRFTILDHMQASKTVVNKLKLTGYAFKLFTAPNAPKLDY